MAINILHTIGLIVTTEDFMFQDQVEDQFHCPFGDYCTVYYFQEGIFTPI